MSAPKTNKIRFTCFSARVGGAFLDTSGIKLPPSQEERDRLSGAAVTGGDSLFPQVDDDAYVLKKGKIVAGSDQTYIVKGYPAKNDGLWLVFEHGSELPRKEYLVEAESGESSPARLGGADRHDICLL